MKSESHSFIGLIGGSKRALGMPPVQLCSNGQNNRFAPPQFWVGTPSWKSWMLHCKWYIFKMRLKNLHHSSRISCGENFDSVIFFTMNYQSTWQKDVNCNWNHTIFPDTLDLSLYSPHPTIQGWDDPWPKYCPPPDIRPGSLLAPTPSRHQTLDPLPCPIPQDIRPWTPPPLLVKSGDHWRPVQTCSFEDPLHQWHLVVVTEARTVSKREVYILLEYFLVYNISRYYHKIEEIWLQKESGTMWTWYMTMACLVHCNSGIWCVLPIPMFQLLSYSWLKTSDQQNWMRTWTLYNKYCCHYNTKVIIISHLFFWKQIGWRKNFGTTNTNNA